MKKIIDFVKGIPDEHLHAIFGILIWTVIAGLFWLGGELAGHWVATGLVTLIFAVREELQARDKYGYWVAPWKWSKQKWKEAIWPSAATIVAAIIASSVIHTFVL